MRLLFINVHSNYIVSFHSHPKALEAAMNNMSEQERVEMVHGMLPEQGQETNTHPLPPSLPFVVLGPGLARRW